MKQNYFHTLRTRFSLFGQPFFLSFLSLIFCSFILLINTGTAYGAGELNCVSTYCLDSFPKTSVKYGTLLNKNDSLTIDLNQITDNKTSGYLYNLKVEPYTEWVDDTPDPFPNAEKNGGDLSDCLTENVLFGIQFESANNLKHELVDSQPCPGEGCKQGFQEIYPLQPDWKFKINTPTDVTKAYIQNLGNCPIHVFASQNDSLELWSGFKTLGDPFVHLDKSDQDYAPDQGVLTIDSLGHHKLRKVHYYTEENVNYPLGALNTISADTFPALGGGVWGDIMIMPDTIRAPHWHMTEAESGFCYQGYGKVGAIVDKDTFPSSDGSGYVNDRMVQEIFIHPMEIFMFPTGAQHYLRNIGTEPFKCILFLRHGVPTNPKILSAISLQNVLGQTPLGVSAAFTNPKDPEIDVSGFTEQKEQYVYASQISNYPNEAFKPSKVDTTLTIKSADADCTGSTNEWMMCFDAICPNVTAAQRPDVCDEYNAMPAAMD
ncbi:cupin domain-containing protein [Moorena bouillonii]|nr:cupin domain-containing protein [Moorena bouillonii]